MSVKYKLVLKKDLTKGAAADAFARKRAIEYPADRAVVVNHPHRFASGRCGKLNLMSIVKHEGFLSFRPFIRL